MRILYHHRTQADGAEGVHIAAMVDAFRALGHDVRLLGAEPGGTVSSSSGSRLKATLPSAAFEAVAAAYNLPEYLAVRRALRSFRPDLVYARHARFGLGAVRAAAGARVPSVLEVNCLFADELYHQFEPLAFRALARTLEHRALRAASRVVAVSSPLADRIRAIGIDAVMVLPNGVDTERFDPARANGREIRERYAPTAACLVGWAGVLRDWHGLDLLIDAVAPLAGVHLLVVGDGPGRHAVEARAAAAGLAGRLHVTGRVAHEAMPAYIAAMDLAVVADDRTGVASPMKLLEYMAMGKAVVAPDLPNIRDVVRPDIEASLFTPRDGRALTAALERLVGNAALRLELGEKARRRVRLERSWDANARAVLSSLFPD